ncbi:hypothetical protein ASPCAL03156 [Aspergillus calidoustus]|uniref:Uncharacterized protein n=1 Tax=Aspergillus calidoustus TaxID=454130 RepID=A0A0U5GNM0_ASPCI|nr:hypothetical protein ASPCAL03156 [Aspergillus calidoustus]
MPPDPDLVQSVFERDDDDEDTCCAVCGVLLDRPNETDSLVYAWFETIAFRFVDSQLETFSREEVGFPWSGDEYPTNCVHNCMDDSPIIAVHVKCFELLQRLVRSREKQQDAGDEPRSLEDFWKVFCSRIDDYKRGPCGLLHSWMCQPRILEPHEYYFPASWDTSNELQWPTGHPEAEEFEIEPFPISGLTTAILSFLQPLPAGLRTSHVEYLTGAGAEAEIKLLRSRPFVNPPEECVRALPPTCWRTLVMERHIFPWLWDLEHACLQITPPHTTENLSDGSLASYEAENFWDWELLARQLAQVDIFREGSRMESAPLGLRNRRRIWRLLEEARIDDIEPYADRKMWQKHYRDYGWPTWAKDL